MDSRHHIQTCLVVLATLACGRPALSENYAFIVGVGGYDEKHLNPLDQYPRNDAIAFRDVLLASGFKPENVVLMVDDPAITAASKPVGRFLPEAKKIRTELGLLLASDLKREDTLIIALAGHGVQYKREKEAYFCPLDTRLDDRDSLISLDWLYDQLKYDKDKDEGCRPRQKLLLVDACRNDPQSATFRSTSGEKLASVSMPQLAPLPEGVVALFSCAEGQAALQHAPLDHGVFFYHVLEGLKGAADSDSDRYVTLDEMIAYAKSQTTTYARVKLAATQTPRQKGYIDGTWNLRSTFQGVAAGDVGEFSELKIKMAWCPPGKFKMGSPENDPDAEEDERPQVDVTLTQGFWMARTEVTQGQWKSVMGTEPWKGKIRVHEGANYPASFVSWDDAKKYSVLLTEREQKAGRLPAGWQFRLPTEAEWEYACRAGSGARYCFGDDAKTLGDYAWFGEHTHPNLVGRKQASPWNLCDMHGNVYEWCEDIYQAKLLGGTDPKGATSGTHRIYRGGGSNNTAADCRSANRSHYESSLRVNFLGFRLILSH